MSNLSLREFKGYKVSEDFKMSVSYKGSNYEVNLQEVMALRLSGHPFTTSDKAYSGTTCADELGLGYGQLKSIRTSEYWEPARDAFKSANGLEDAEFAKLAGFRSGSSNGNSEKVKCAIMTKGDAQALGLRIASALSSEETGFLLSDHQGVRGSYFTRGIESFVVATKRNLYAAKKMAAAKQAEELRLAKEKRHAELKDDAIAFLKDLGIEKPTDAQIESTIDKLDS